MVNAVFIDLQIVSEVRKNRVLKKNPRQHKFIYPLPKPKYEPLPIKAEQSEEIDERKVIQACKSKWGLTSFSTILQNLLKFENVKFDWKSLKYNFMY